MVLLCVTGVKMSDKLIYNAIQIPDGRVLVSRYRHDYNSVVDPNNGKTYMVDGGLDYSRRSFNGDEVDLCKYDNEPHEIQRQYVSWGTYGKNGDQPLKYITVAEMETAHIEAVLKECSPRDVIRKCMENEIEYRKSQIT